jgi:hypothetical protein
MYLQKQSQSAHGSNRRLYPRVRGRLTTEISGSELKATLGILTNLSLGGCYVETRSLLLPGSKLKLTFSHDHTNVMIESEVVRMDMGIGAALKFTETSHEVRASLQRILEQLAALDAAVDRKRNLNAAVGGTL